jgi:hypothetical protein
MLILKRACGRQLHGAAAGGSVFAVFLLGARCSAPAVARG